MDTGVLGKIYHDGEIIIHQGDIGDCMYVIQEGQVEILIEEGGKEMQLAIRRKGDIFGEMAIFEKERRSATVRAVGTVRLLTVDEKNFVRRIHEDPSLAYRLVEMMSHRIRELSNEVARLKFEASQ
ncbi:MAG: cyclic nucleotide-binding domain-containing protein [Anaerolineales bacterium]